MLVSKVAWEKYKSGEISGDFLEQCGTRMSGNTYAKALLVVGKAMSSPRETFLIPEESYHFPLVLGYVNKIIEDLSLEGFEVKRYFASGTAYITYEPFVEVEKEIIYKEKTK